VGVDERISRRKALELAAGTALGAGVLGALPSSAGAEAGAAAGAVAGAQMVMLIRHAEKPPPSGTPSGVTAAGLKDSKSLIVEGWQRAGALVELFDPAAGPIRNGIARPSALFAASTAHKGSKRPLETITPLSARLGLKVNTTIKPSKTSSIASLLASTPGTPLAAWQHQYIPSIAQQLGTVHPSVPTKWPGNRFDIVWVFTRQSDGSWAFTQVPQLLLAGDSPTVIT
jgi:hypothetical protein